MVGKKKASKADASDPIEHELTMVETGLEVSSTKKEATKQAVLASSSKSLRASSRQSSKKLQADGAAGDATSQDRSLVGKAPRTFCRLIVCCLCLGLIAGIVILVWFVIDEGDDDPQPVASCGDCHCILDGDVPTCPSPAPISNYSKDFLQALREQEATNAFPLLNCDPYVDSPCEYDPPNNALGDDAVCGLHYDDDVNCTTYKLQSYASRTVAEEAGAFVTHLGECGACSTTFDLAVYLEYIDLTTFGTRCGARALASYDEGVKCFMDLGFSEPCADIRTDNARNTGRECTLTCALNDLRDKPNNGAPPFCPLNDCLTCDEEESGPLFKQHAGRTRRRSGLLSAIARKCSSIADITHQVCPLTTPLAG